MASESIELDLNGQKWTLQVREWPYEVGLPWTAYFVKMAGVFAGAGAGVDISSVLQHVDDKKMLELVETASANTVCVGPDKKAVPYESIKALLKGRYDIPLKLSTAALRVTFGPFFASLVPELTGLFSDEAQKERAA